MKINKMMTFILAFIFTITSSAQNLCSNIFKTVETLQKYEFKNIKLIELPESSMDKSNSAAYTQNLISLLNMLGQTKNLNFSEKLSEDKGELYLAKELENDSSLEFFYTEDKRGESSEYILSEVYYVKANGSSIKLSKEALYEDGFTLKNDNYIVISEKSVLAENPQTKFLTTHSIVDRAEFKKWLATNKIEVPSEFALLDFNLDSSIAKITQWIESLSANDQNKILSMVQNTASLEVPTVIKGDLYKELKKWADRIEVLSHQRLKSINDPSQIKWVLLEAERKKLWNAIENVIRKQSIKLIIFGIVGYLASTLNSSDDETKEKLKKLKTKVSKLTPPESQEAVNKQAPPAPLAQPQPQI